MYLTNTVHGSRWVHVDSMFHRKQHLHTNTTAFRLILIDFALSGHCCSFSLHKNLKLKNGDVSEEVFCLHPMLWTLCFM